MKCSFCELEISVNSNLVANQNKSIAICLKCIAEVISIYSENLNQLFIKKEKNYAESITKHTEI